MHEGFHTVAVTCERPVSLRGLQAFAAALTHHPGQALRPARGGLCACGHQAHESRRQ